MPADARPRSRMKRTLLKLGVLLLLGAIVTFGVRMLILNWRREHTFDATRWKAVTGGDHYRVRVVDELLDTHHFPGMTRTEVIDFLGPPDADAPKTAPDNIVYWLGPQRHGFPIDDDWLVITFNERGIAINARTETD